MFGKLPRARMAAWLNRKESSFPLLSQNYRGFHGLPRPRERCHGGLTGPAWSPETPANSCAASRRSARAMPPAARPACPRHHGSARCRAGASPRPASRSRSAARAGPRTDRPAPRRCATRSGASRRSARAACARRRNGAPAGCSGARWPTRPAATRRRHARPAASRRSSRRERMISRQPSAAAHASASRTSCANASRPSKRPCGSCVGGHALSPWAQPASHQAASNATRILARAARGRARSSRRAVGQPAHQPCVARRRRASSRR